MSFLIFGGLCLGLGVAAVGGLLLWPRLKRRHLHRQRRRNAHELLAARPAPTPRDVALHLPRTWTEPGLDDRYKLLRERNPTFRWAALYDFLEETFQNEHQVTSHRAFTGWLARPDARGKLVDQDAMAPDPLLINQFTGGPVEPQVVLLVESEDRRYAFFSNGRICEAPPKVEVPLPDRETRDLAQLLAGPGLTVARAPGGWLLHHPQVGEVMLRKQARGFLLEAPSWSRACVSLQQVRAVMLDLAAQSR